MDEINEFGKNDKNCRDPSDPDCGVHKGPSQYDPKHKGFKFSIWYFIIALLVLNLFNLAVHAPQETIIDFSRFKEKVKSKQIKRVEMGDQYYTGFPYVKDSTKTPQARKSITTDTTIYKTAKVDDPGFIKLMDSLQVQYYAVPVEKSRLLDFFFAWVLPMVLMVGLWRLLFGKIGKLGAGVMSFGQNRAQLVAEGDTQTRFSDVAGADEAKEELVEVVDFLKNPEKYVAIGGKIPKGVLLVGPPGTGKTLLARAVAGEASVPFFKMSGADFVELFVGVGAARVRDLFRQAREKAPCIIFIDELDAIGKTRAPGIGGNDEREQTLNQLLVEMDGFDSRTGVIILAATNRPEILDGALLRPGRFDRQVLVDRPDLAGREAILRLHAQQVKLDDSIDFGAIARSTPGFAGADLANIVNEAALLAVRAGRLKVNQKDFEEAIEKVMAGLQKKSRLINAHEREIVAHHETGHALVAAFTPGADPVQKITIVPRGFGALGYTLQLPSEERFLMTEKELLGRIDVLLGGRAAEEIIYSQISTGAANDLVKATDIARRMISEYGMSDKFQNVVLQSQKQPMFMTDAAYVPPQREYSEVTQQYIDEQVAQILRARYVVVKDLLKTKSELLVKIAHLLLEKETIDTAEFKQLVGDRIEPA